ncbi:MAG: DUF393 domain-containing protein [Nocardioides sp.]|nr:DUF393 domain-containing protein [Nocardioides sp.]
MLIYDQDCGFCQWSLRWALRLGATCDHQPAQTADLPALGLSLDEALEAAWFVTPSGPLRGHEAIAQVLLSSRWWPVRMGGRLVGSRVARPVAAPAYAWVARNRHRMPGASESCRVNHPS